LDARLKLLAVGCAGIALGIAAFWLFSGAPEPGADDVAKVRPAPTIPRPAADSTAPPAEPARPPTKAPSAPPPTAPAPAADDVEPALDADCAYCFDGISLSWDRSPDEIAAIRRWSKDEHRAASEEIWARNEAGELDYATARRDDQSIQVDRVLGGELDPEVRTEILDVHEEMQAALTQAREAGLGPEGQVDAMRDYKDALDDLLRPDQVERLLGRAPSPVE